VSKVLIREMLFVDDAALADHTEVALQRLITLFAEACTEFGLTIRLRMSAPCPQLYLAITPWRWWTSSHKWRANIKTGIGLAEKKREIRKQ
jgi:hypothetical protein